MEWIFIRPFFCSLRIILDAVLSTRHGRTFAACPLISWMMIGQPSQHHGSIPVPINQQQMKSRWIWKGSWHLSWCPGLVTVTSLMRPVTMKITISHLFPKVRSIRCRSVIYLFSFSRCVQGLFRVITINENYLVHSDCFAIEAFKAIFIWKLFFFLNHLSLLHKFRMCYHENFNMERITEKDRNDVPSVTTEVPQPSTTEKQPGKTFNQNRFQLG